MGERRNVKAHRIVQEKRTSLRQYERVKPYDLCLEFVPHFLGRTVSHIRNRFKYLKGKYMAVNDNMSDRATGAKRLKFDYLEEFDDLFGKEPNVTPVSECDSSNATAQFPPLNVNQDYMSDFIEDEMRPYSDTDERSDQFCVQTANKKKGKVPKKRKVDVLIEKLDEEGSRKQTIAGDSETSCFRSGEDYSQF